MPNKELKHTPVPWEAWLDGHITGPFKNGRASILGQTSGDNSLANAKFIVTACNSYQQLKDDQAIYETLIKNQGERIKELVEALEVIVKNYKYICNGYYGKDCSKFTDILNAKKVLSKAKGAN